MATPREVLALCREKGVRSVDLWFTDLLGRWQRLTLPVPQLDEELFEQGIACESTVLGSAQAGSEGFVLLVPQPETAFVDGGATQPALGLICSAYQPITGEDCRWDPRNVAVRAANYASSAGAIDAVQVGWGLEFYLLRSARGLPKRLSTSGRDEMVPVGLEPMGSEFEPLGDGLENGWVAGGAEQASLRTQLAQQMAACGVPAAAQHALGCAAGQSHLDILPQQLVRAADGLMVSKHLTRQLARAQGWMATFMPRPLAHKRGSRLSMQVSFWNDQRPLFAGSGFAGLSEVAMHAMGGVLRHAAALTALTNPSSNGFARLACEMPRHGYSQWPDALLQVPNYQANPAAKRIDLQLADATANPYLALAGVLMAMVDGIQNKISPGPALEQLEGTETSGEATRGSTLPRDLDAALSALQADHEFLLRGEVFTPDLLATWIREKRATDVEALRARPHPHEYSLYFDC